MFYFRPKASPSSCVTMAIALFSAIDTINDKVILFQFIVYIFLHSGSYY